MRYFTEFNIPLPEKHTIQIAFYKNSGVTELQIHKNTNESLSVIM